MEEAMNNFGYELHSEILNMNLGRQILGTYI